MTTAAVVALLMLSAGGCVSAIDTAVRTATDRAAQSTGQQVGDAIGQRTGAAMANYVAARFPDVWTPHFTSLYVGYLFNVAFHSGSYAVEQTPYAPGQWTRWRLTDGSDASASTMERAFLARTENGGEWWRVAYHSAESDDTITLEGLFSPDRSELVRLRAQFPGEEPKELPVQEGTYGYVEPITLTEESLAGATVGTQDVAVPAGRFTARHVRYGDMASTLEWWLDPAVPGGLVKYLRKAGDADNEMDTWTAELDAYGDGATSRLGVL